MPPNKIFILTGAGVSAESGLSTFRDKDGLWSKYNIDEVASIEGYRRDPQRVLEFLGLARWRPAQFGNRFPGEYRDKMSDATRRRLLDYFAPYNERLFAHLGKRLAWDR